MAHDKMLQTGDIVHWNDTAFTFYCPGYKLLMVSELICIK